MLAFYLCIMVPQRLYEVVEAHGSMTASEEGPNLWVDWCSDGFFLLSIFMTCRVFALTEINEQGKTLHITERDQMVVEYYRSGWMMLDVFTFFPYDLLRPGLGSPNLLRIPKLLIALKIPKMVGDLKKHAKRRGVDLSLDNILIVNLSVATVLFTHWTSIVWAMLSENKEYISAVYWALTTLTTVGFGDITPSKTDSRWFAVSLMILGSCFTAAVIANITSMAHKVVISEDNAQHVSTCVEKYLVERDLPHDIRERCLRYFAMLKDDVNEEKILKELLPPPFIPDIAMHVYEDVVRSSDVFSRSNLSDGLVRSIALLFKEEVVVEHDWVKR